MGHQQDDEITPVPPKILEKPTEIVQTIERAELIDDPEGLDERIEPNEQQLATLRRISETIPMRAWFPPLQKYF